MLPDEIAGFHYLAAPENPILIPSNFSSMLQNDVIPNLHLSRILNNFPSSHFPPVGHEYVQQSTCLSNNSTSDEGDDHQLRVVDERKQRRMISNRESARRSRMRKQRHLDELWSQVVRLRTENHNLIDKLNHVSESHDRFLQENARLKEEAYDLRQMVTQLQISNSFPNPIKDCEECPASQLVSSDLSPQTPP